MDYSASRARVPAAFDTFLFASVGEDQRGALLSVLSALARVNLDPWQEAAKLARMPVKAATQRLASLIAALPEPSLVGGDAAAIAARLIALLPPAPSAKTPQHETTAGVEKAANSSATMNAMFFIIVALFVVSALGNFRSHQRTMPAHSAPAPDSTKVTP
jgi:hypothetical protein